MAALASALTSLRSHAVALCLAAIALVTWLNLRGTRESASIFAAPTYVFIGMMLLLLTVGIGKAALDGFTGHAGSVDPAGASGPATSGVAGVGLFLILGAF